MRTLKHVSLSIVLVLAVAATGFLVWAYTPLAALPEVLKAQQSYSQLQTTGWMHNRTRVIAASFLKKDLLIDWRLGERHFMQHLLDGDPAANNGGWQRVAGTGTDAAPYFRIFNPMLQGVMFDPQGAYVRRWAPELTAVPNDFTHAPWKMPADVQDRAGCVVGKDYPAPLVDHALARERALNVYKVKG